MRLENARTRREGIARKVARGLLATAYAIAGTAHLFRPAGFIAITPHWVPAPATVVMATGVAELAGATGLLIPRLRVPAGIGLALYALCVWPANVNHAIHDIPLGGAHLSWWYHGPRLMAQPVIIWWALWGSGAIDWPWREQPRQ